MKKPRAQSLATHVAIALNAVLAVVDGETPKALCVRYGENALGLPYGPFDPERHRTFEIGVREWVARQTNVSLGFIEQLYTFGDKGREAPAAVLAEGAANDRVVSVGYLALAPEPADILAEGAEWRDWYFFFPWEDWRGGEPHLLKAHIIPLLENWIADKKGDARAQRRARVNAAFALDGRVWEEERIIDRYEIMYEAGLVFEARRDREGAKDLSAAPASDIRTGDPMISDHRRILATAIGRLRGKLKYRPIIFEMAGPHFTLLQLQRTVEAIVGFRMHKQNFRRSAEKSGFVTRTGETTLQAGGRPAALFRVDREGLRERAASGLAIPRLRPASEPLG
jgi:hypothetical protein